MALYGIVLAGGSARRLSGVDKPLLEVNGVPLLRRSLAALSSAREVIAVGPAREGFSDVRWVREDPPGGGPAAALAAGLDALEPVSGDEVAMLAGDLAGITGSTVERLINARHGHDGAVLVDHEGRRQWLAGVWAYDALRSALPDESAGLSLRGVLGTLSVVDVPALGTEAEDVDTEADLARVRASFDLHSRHTGDAPE